MILKKIAMMLMVQAMSTTVGVQNTDELYADAKEGDKDAITIQKLLWKK